MSLVFAGSYTAFHHQCFKMVGILTHHFERHMHLNPLNPYAKPSEPKQEVDKKDVKEENQQQEKEQ